MTLFYQPEHFAKHSKTAIFTGGKPQKNVGKDKKRSAKKQTLTNLAFFFLTEKKCRTIQMNIQKIKEIATEIQTKFNELKAELDAPDAPKEETEDEKEE